MPNILILYRLEDCALEGRRLMTYLGETLEGTQVASVEESMRSGSIIPAQLQRYMEAADVVLVVLGKNWMGLTPAGYRSITKPGDALRLGLLAGAERVRAGSLMLVPMLVQGMRMQDLDLPAELEFLRHLNAIEVGQDRIAAHVKTLAERLKLRNWGEPQPWPAAPSVLDQGIQLDQKAALLPAGVAAHRGIKADDRICLQRDPYGHWQYEIMNPSGDGLNSFFEQDLVALLQGLQEQEAVGRLMAWYGAPMAQVFARIDPPIPSRWWKRLFYRATGQWEPFARLDTAYYGLLSLIQDFAEHVLLDQNRHVIPLQVGEAITPTMRVMGYLGPQEARTFGTYLVTLTHQVAGVSDGTDQVVCFPRVPGTDLCYLDIQAATRFSQVQWAAHVGLGEFGYHLVY